MDDGRIRLRKKTAGFGLFLILIGLIVLAYPVQQSSNTSVSFFTWDIPIKTLDPGKRTFAVQLMRPDEWFQLNVSSTDLVELRTSFLTSGGTVKTPIFVETGTTFGQIVRVTQTGSYEVAISNVSPSVVTLAGNVVAKRTQASGQILTPYGFLGFILMLGGAAVSIFGIFKKPKTRFKHKSSSGKRMRT